MPWKIFRRQNGPEPTPQIKKRRSFWFYLLITAIIAVVGVVAWVGITGFLAIKHITATNINAKPAFLSGTLSPSEVKTEGDSRINILLAGIGGTGHNGPNLTDTLEIYSIDPINKTIAILSIPRDLYVTLPDGSHGKINSINNPDEGAVYCKKHSCPAGADPGGAAMEGTIGALLNIKINYFVRMDFVGFQQLVNTLGGVTIDAPTTLSDPFYPCPDPSTAYCPIYITAGVHQFNGTTALEYARSRETSTDFARAARQQQLMSAIRTKALTLNILANPAKVTSLLNELGSNLKTDIPTSDLSQIVTLVRQIDSTKTTTTVLDTSTGSPLTTSSNTAAGYIIYPTLGLNNFTGVQALVAGVLKDPYVVKEAAQITVINATGAANQAATAATMLTNLGYNVVSTTTAPTTQKATTITANSSDPYTETLLQKRLDASILPQPSGTTTGLTLTLGTSYLAK